MPETHKLFSHLPALQNMIRRVAIEAGNITLDYFDEGGFNDAKTKKDGSPVTLADEAAEKLIIEKLIAIAPGISIVGEESVAKGRTYDLTRSEWFWLVDPLDGTKEFISGRGDYTVNIALIHKGVPVMGVVYAPVHGELYAGHKDGGAIKWNNDSDKEKPIAVREPPEKGLVAVCSKSHGRGERLDQFLNHYKIAKRASRGSSLKMCLVAEGKADIYPRLGPTCEWDTAAAHAVLNAAGGRITDLNGTVLSYGGHDPKFLNPEFVAYSAALNLPENFS